MLYDEEVTREQHHQDDIKEKLKQFAVNFINEYFTHFNCLPSDLESINTDASLGISGDEHLDDHKALSTNVTDV